MRLQKLMVIADRTTSIMVCLAPCSRAKRARLTHVARADAAGKEHDEALARVRKAQQNARRHPNSRQASEEVAAAHRHLEDVEKQYDEQHQGGQPTAADTDLR